MKIIKWFNPLFIALLTFISLSALAQADYPTRAVKIIVPFPAGGTSDVMGRMVADGLTKYFKQSFIVENIGGGGGVVGTKRATEVQPDGYTLILTGVGQNAVAHGLDPNVKYNSITDFIHISQIHIGPNILVVNPNSPFKTLKELVDYARANPGKFKQTVTNCSAPKKDEKCLPLGLVGIPYRGGGPMMTAILSGEIPMMFINQDVAYQHIQAGKLRPLAVTSEKRNPLYPNVPTIAESGFPTFEAISWSGLSAPKGTPKVIIDKLEAGMNQVMTNPEIKQRMESQGFVIPPQGSKPYTEFIKSEIQRWTAVIKQAGIKPE